MGVAFSNAIHPLKVDFCTATTTKQVHDFLPSFPYYTTKKQPVLLLIGWGRHKNRFSFPALPLLGLEGDRPQSKFNQ